MPRAQAVLIALSLVALLLAASVQAAPKLTDAKIEPASARIGDHVVITVAVEDPAAEIVELKAVVVEASELTASLNDQGEGDDKQARDGIWSAGATVPPEAIPGIYHVAIWPRDAAGNAFKAGEEFVKATLGLVVTSSESGAAGSVTEAAPALVNRVIQSLDQPDAARMKWWSDARFGMFIHWGVYSIPARGEWVMHAEKIPAAEYARFAEQFDPTRYDPRQWVALAKEAGMKYMVLTSRHHDGFSLFASKVSSFTAPKTAAGRDLIREYVDACHAAAMKVGFYYSLLDWRYPAYWSGPDKDPAGWAEFRKYVHEQVRELMTNYGKIDILWYDGGWPYDANAWQSVELNAMVRRLQPHIIIDNRSQLPEDFDTPEQEIKSSERPWESCMTMNDNWGYVRGNNRYKSTGTLIQNLVRCVSGNGNYLLNVGPKPDGTFPVMAQTRLKQIGRWMKVNGESVYGCGRAPFADEAVGLTTAKGDTVYLHMFKWPGEEIVVSGVTVPVTSAKLLASGERVTTRQEGDRLILSGMPMRAPDPWDSVIAITVKP